ncbi:hypothetical protein [Luteimonas aquatica]|uniref:hypothetical protein n=1 Tax=Luteimonas aquatica TaxID=450364 RepID=UPI001F57B08A|nr:hypothetical protein [Luteimonas aquatica]
MTTATKQARYRARKLEECERLDLFLAKPAARELRRQAKAEGRRAGILAADLLAAALLKSPQPWPASSED